MYKIVLVVFLAGCRPIAETRNSFQKTKYCYSGENTHLDSLIHINGYYTFKVEYLRNTGYPSVQKLATYYFNVLFFSDGTFLYYYYVSGNNGQWGKYVLESDTIKAQFIEPPGGMSWAKGEVWFKIIDSTSIKEIYFKYREPITYEEVSSEKDSSMLRGEFVKYNSLPNPDNTKFNWLKKRKWFWCDEAKYNEWKRSKKAERKE
jgi:hypothetical protein